MSYGDWSSDVCSSDLATFTAEAAPGPPATTTASSGPPGKSAATRAAAARSEERRVGKECGTRAWRAPSDKKVPEAGDLHLGASLELALEDSLVLDEAL